MTDHKSRSPHEINLSWTGPKCGFAEVRKATVFCSGAMKLYPVDHCEKCQHHTARLKAPEAEPATAAVQYSPGPLRSLRGR